MRETRQAAIECLFEQPIYAPDGTVEGALVKLEGTSSQLVVERGDEFTADILGAAKAAQRLIVQADRQGGPSPKGPSEHPVYTIAKVISVDGANPTRANKGPAIAPYKGMVVCFNYARHGAKNGVVLDTGDFIHLKPDGFARFKPNVGDRVEADGDAWPLASGTGYVVEAVTFNGKPVSKKAHA
jgi:hypothetical protein